ncbi:MAG: hypothetical protein DHS20C17_11000 [Cyclobacteriaceae bacterium]|nr:MAG: hypothetical protein DHS20C17_11000 [Cyclobacteriaceae bacterium]
MINQFKSIANRLYNHLFFYPYRSKSAREVFDDIYSKKIWKSKSYSGPGSELDQTKLVRKTLLEVFVNYSIKSVLDVPCGDWLWMRLVDLSAVGYTGGDIVQRVVDENQQFASDRVSFHNLNILEDTLPQHDLILCRDCLVHFSYQDIRVAIRNIIGSQCKFLLTTTFPAKKNYNIITGNWRPINLQEPPFMFPNPIAIFNEGCTEGNGRYKDKSLALWDLNELRSLESFKNQWI